VLEDEPQRLLAARRRDDVVVGPGEHRAERSDVLRVVVDHQDADAIV
jgi:hypothetical protein